MTAKDIPGNITLFQHGAFWVDKQSAYVVGGAVNDEAWLSRDGQFLPSNFSTYKASTVFRYDIQSDRWSSETAVQPSSGSDVRDSFAAGAFAYNPLARKAYYFSGTNGPGARKMYPNDIAGYVGRSNEEVTGNGNLLTFETDSFKWTNVTTDTQLTTTGTEYGQLVFLPGTMSSTGGVAIGFGGNRRDTGDIESMRQVLIYDAWSDKWHSQATSVEGGTFPPGRQGFCAVAASAPDNSSHNIYMYAGESTVSVPNAYSDLWVLSIPSFKWIRIDGKHPTRKAHKCDVLADRYMVTYGGNQGGWGDEGDGDACDDLNYGLRLFDMSNLTWTTKYDGPAQEANAYKVPKAVYEKIGGDASGSATQTAPSAGFETADVKELFQQSKQETPPPTTSADPSNEKTTNVGAIAGGVVGGVVGLGLIIGAVFFTLRRRKRESAYAYGQPSAMANLVEADGNHGYATELMDHNNPGGKPVHEIYTSHRQNPQELYAGDVEEYTAAPAASGSKPVH
ncbi:hypothetical protein BU24DRAFT_420844 [Aaosphaeria arxii CBS 175.79]|uniref:Galactose oxidase n=1 Tax=Aaosphaeria arxii CBS 175.79 TaxID=1450172 RepID=A0A6A5XWS5_9PLEO|nr:uncharacterized protein BU24DRAFT_420844 [Aaosphaeria arxii CBS 175.79]KAF2017788.1 hypothetical protein BU24DRAFT_420844 [Aaosphaeria arxii CBS 175.79]